MNYISVIFGFVAIMIGSTEGQLNVGFYSSSCPRADQIVQEYVKQHVPNAPSIAPALLRLHFHDCFVRGCDASVLLNSTSNNQAEKSAIPNLTLRGFDFIDKVKSVLENECPGVVSCADIIALVARDATVEIGGPSWPVPTGRRDGTISNQTEALQNIPPPTANFSTLQTLFSNVGLNTTDLVLLSGAHTIGVSHCAAFSNRLYNFTGNGDMDPALDSEYAENLKSRKCTTINDNTTLVEMDPGSRKTFDLSYYVHVLKRRGLFQSDSALTTNSLTNNYMIQLVNGPPQNFFAAFGNAMVKMGQANVLTGSAGEIRKQCAIVNAS